MDTLAPQSLLDNRSAQQKTSLVVPDRLTGKASPGRSPNQSISQEEDIDVRVPQPYRTSFSAVLKPSRIKRDRSRSASPGAPVSTSMKSERSHSPASRKLSPKHVTYDAKVTVRHSDSYENETAALAGGDPLIDPAFDPSFTEDENSAVDKKDYSSQIREMTELIVKEYSEKKEAGFDRTDSGQNGKRVAGRQKRSKNGVVNGGLPQPQNSLPPVHQLSKEYEHDRTVSYRHAITNQYSDEIKQLAEAKIEERYPPGGRITHSNLVKNSKTERSNSVPYQQDSSNRLTPTKKSVGGSIGSFFKRLSPNLGRKSRKEKGSTSSVDTTGSQDSFSRNKVRNSFMKLMGRSKSRSDPKTRSENNLDDFSVDREAGFLQDKESSQIPSSSNRILKSIEQNTLSDRDVYQRFKDKQSPKGQGEVPTSSQCIKEPSRQGKPQAMRVTQPPQSTYSNESTPPSQMNKENYSSVDGAVPEKDSNYIYDQDKAHKPDPPSSLDVRVVPKSSRILQTSMFSTLSNDESIGECSLDVNLTDSEASLPRGGSTTSSKRPVLSSRENTLSESALSPTSPQRELHTTKYKRGSENGVLFTSMPKLASTADIEIKECTKIPSYLKLSCAVSGYGRYSQYSSYKSIEKRSPYSSCSSLQLDQKTPDMPVTRVTSPMRRTSASNSNSDLGLICPQPLSYGNGYISNGASDLVLNGHTSVADDNYPTGDRKLDGEYFLNIMRQWENRLTSHCQLVEGDLEDPGVPEEARGKIRAAVGKSNLLLTQKFKQFHDLCLEHMNPSEDGKVLKWADLQGFWEMIKIQADNIDDMFAELELMRQNGWKELVCLSRGSSVNSSPKSGSLSLSNGSTPSGTPGSRRKTTKTKNTPESSPERTEKMRAAAKAREEARKKMLADKRAAMKQKQNHDDVEIFVS